MTLREQYWREVAAYLRSSENLQTKSGKDLDWETLEILAENHGFRRTGVSDPYNMANNALAQLFFPMNV